MQCAAWVLRRQQSPKQMLSGPPYLVRTQTCYPAGSQAVETRPTASRCRKGTLGKPPYLKCVWVLYPNVQAIKQQ